MVLFGPEVQLALLVQVFLELLVVIEDQFDFGGSAAHNHQAGFVELVNLRVVEGVLIEEVGHKMVGSGLEVVLVSKVGHMEIGFEGMAVAEFQVALEHLKSPEEVGAVD